MPFRPNELRYFIAVAEEGQITRAAEKLYIAQPALSHAIAQLESDLGIELLERHPRGVTLTAAGEVFLAKARVAVASEIDAVETGRMLARRQAQRVEFGFVVAAPGLHSPGPLKGLAEAHPEIEIHYRELPFPFTPTHSWLSEVDVAACHAPPADPQVWSRPIGREPRVVLAAKDHPLAGRDTLKVADVLDETFIGFDPATDREWAGFWSLDDHRGAPPRRVTTDRVANGQEVLAALALRTAITTAPAVVGTLLTGLQTGVVTIPLDDAQPSHVVLVGRNDRRTPPVETMLAFFRSLDRDSASAMSQENVEIVRGLFEATNRRDFAAVLDAYDENVMLVVDESIEPVDAGIVYGREGVINWYGEWLRSFARDYRFDIEDARGVGDRVFLVARHHGRGLASGTEVEQSVAYAYTVRAGKIVRVEMYANPAAALKAVGLEE